MLLETIAIDRSLYACGAIAAYGLMRRRRRKQTQREHRASVHSAQVIVQNESAWPITVQAYGGNEVLKIWPACRAEVAPGETYESQVHANFSSKTLQVAIRMRYGAKLLSVQRGATVVVEPSQRGEGASISSKPRESIDRSKDISHWSSHRLPASGNGDLANVDSIFGPRSRLDRLQAWLARSLYLEGLVKMKEHTDVAVPLRVEHTAHPMMPARIAAAHSVRDQLDLAPAPELYRAPQSLDLPSGAIVVGTVRCGYGHHRIALALSSFGEDQAPALLHDLAAIEGVIAPVKMLRKLDSLYSQLSRLASEDRTKVLKKGWNRILASGTNNASRSMRLFCERLKPLLMDLPQDTPIIAAHTFVAITALLCGFTRVVNLVFDNHAQAVHVVPPPAINLVQTPKCEQQLLEMGVPPENVRLVGHFIPKALADGAIQDTQRRIQRSDAGEPRRLLFSVGGAGAQKTFITKMLKKLTQLSQDSPRGMSVFINVGDHVHMQAAVAEKLSQYAMPRGLSVAHFHGLDAAVEFADQVRFRSTDFAFALFSADEPMQATAITDLLIGVSDVLVTKPSELAFYPIPKLHIQRVGDHEAFSAVRAYELGDGTKEQPTVAAAVKQAKILVLQDAVFIKMCDSVLKQARDGVYDGARKAFDFALLMR